MMAMGSSTLTVCHMAHMGCIPNSRSSHQMWSNFIPFVITLWYIFVITAVFYTFFIKFYRVISGLGKGCMALLQSAMRAKPMVCSTVGSSLTCIVNMVTQSADPCKAHSPIHMDAIACSQVGRDLLSTAWWVVDHPHPPTPAVGLKGTCGTPDTTWVTLTPAGRLMGPPTPPWAVEMIQKLGSVRTVSGLVSVNPPTHHTLRPLPAPCPPWLTGNHFLPISLLQRCQTISLESQALHHSLGLWVALCHPIRLIWWPLWSRCWSHVAQGRCQALKVAVFLGKASRQSIEKSLTLWTPWRLRSLSLNLTEG